MNADTDTKFGNTFTLDSSTTCKKHRNYYTLLQSFKFESFKVSFIITRQLYNLI